MENIIFNPAAETLSRDEIHAIQSRELQKVTRRVYENVPFYRKKMDALGVKPEDIKTAEDIKYLPFTEKNDLRDNYPFGLFAVPRDQIVRVHASSGTTGKPTVAGYTQNDLNNWAELMARSLSCAGVNKNSVVHVAYGYGLFTGGLGAHYGAERIGATVIPVSGGNTQRQLMLLKDFGATALACTPSYAMNLADAMRALYDGIYGAQMELQKQYVSGDQISLISPAVQKIERSFVENELTVSALAGLCGISEVYFRRLFLNVFGISPKEYIIQKRIEYAKDLLLSGDFSVSEIGRMCGYIEPCHFSREFSKRVGTPPNRYGKL